MDVSTVPWCSRVTRSPNGQHAIKRSCVRCGVHAVVKTSNVLDTCIMALLSPQCFQEALRCR
jgi:hypothetical protein